MHSYPSHRIGLNLFPFTSSYLFSLVPCDKVFVVAFYMLFFHFLEQLKLFSVEEVEEKRKRMGLCDFPIIVALSLPGLYHEKAYL